MSGQPALPLLLISPVRVKEDEDEEKDEEFFIRSSPDFLW
jgi:hypothetical protein